MKTLWINPIVGYSVYIYTSINGVQSIAFYYCSFVTQLLYSFIHMIDNPHRI